ncbi:PspC domain-containing protein [Amycolatopsis sp. H20-H5]|uniref:PspC domain-containing protein n=1 Tax=Amycolatopsis sp. H20-H5 TaxID=3046309 RepID=UPI002DBCAA0A|nr:PspC domain-containing protein [Amycolatopsis sp. H20-H5]MEC3979273.1 PspC domain-containing protein [Amycolatopsis sp. H20-H5]
MNQTTNTRLMRSQHDKMIGGVCAGIGRRFGISPGKVRLLAVVSCLLPGPQFLLYLILWAIMPKDPAH